jgi:hypothetical protein
MLADAIQVEASTPSSPERRPLRPAMKHWSFTATGTTSDMSGSVEMARRMLETTKLRRTSSLVAKDYPFFINCRRTLRILN